MTNYHVNHRQRLRDNFIKKDPDALSDERILELLLTFGIPQKDVYPLAQELIGTYRNLAGVLSADKEQLIKHKGLKDYSAVLLKLVDWIRIKYPVNELKSSEGPKGTYNLFPEDKIKTMTPLEPKPIVVAKQSTGTGIFGKAMLGQAIKMLPKLPETESLKEVRDFLKNNLAFNSEQTRYRNANYIIGRMFPQGRADKALRDFSRYFVGKQELRDVCYYKFCMKESLMIKITEDLFIPSMAAGAIKRRNLKDYLHNKYPQSKSITDCVQAIAEALNASGIAKCTRDTIFYTYRDINLASFAFILHSEFPDPGIYDIKLLERSNAIKLMLWQPDQLLPALFELRNQGILSKVSEIDNVRQFTTQYTLEEVVFVLTRGEMAK